MTLSALTDDCCLTWATLEDDGTEVEEDGGRGAVVSAADEVDLSLRSWSWRLFLGVAIVSWDSPQ